jgi:polyphosphate kinase 2 (PPK2 family)
MLQRSGIILLKYWFSVSDEEQEKRFLERIKTPIKRWKFSPMDLESRHRWADYSKAKDKMFAYTDTKHCPWWVVPSDDKRRARLNCISHLLSQIEYRNVEYPPVTLPELNKEGYVRSPLDEQTFVPLKY